MYPVTVCEAGSQNGECRNDGGEPRFSKQDPLIRVYFVLRNDAALLSFSRALDTVQDFLIKLGIKPRLHIGEISIFSLNNVIVRPTKIMNRADKNWAHF